MKVLVLGGKGLIGNNLINNFSKNSDLKVYATSREMWSSEEKEFFKEVSLLSKIDITESALVIKLLKKVKPNIVINAAGLTKHLPNGNDPLKVLPVNTLAPHQIAEICHQNNYKFIQLSTDCVFSGSKGGYHEEHNTDAKDLYGKSKSLGEPNTETSLTVRVSTIGHELNTNYGLLNWFLNQKNTCKGYVENIFSGFTVDELSNIFCNHIFNNLEIKGLYHISSHPISKYDLLHLFSKIYEHKIEIHPETSIKINRSLNSDKFRFITNYQPPDWSEQIYSMYSLSMRNKKRQSV